MAILAVLAATLALLGLAVTGGQAEARANPVYWLILAPVAWWGGGLSGFGARQVRLMMPAIVVAPLLAVVCLTIAYTRGETITLWVVATVVTIIAALACRAFYDRSLLKREGPDRWR
jgi:peptidoglycan/LPS O-acetylase OafA/YrhL